MTTHVGAAGVVRADSEVAAHRVDAVAQVPQPAGGDHGRYVEPVPVVAHEQLELVADDGQPDLDPAGGGVLDGVLHRFDAAEVQGRLELRVCLPIPSSRTATGTALEATTSRTAAATPSSVRTVG